MRIRFPVEIEVTADTQEAAQTRLQHALMDMSNDEVHVVKIGEPKRAAAPPNPNELEYSVGFEEGREEFANRRGAAILRYYELSRVAPEDLTQHNYGYMAAVSKYTEEAKRELAVGGVLLHSPSGKPMVEMTEDTF